MANKKISELDDAGTITTSDEIPLARAGRTYKAKIGLSIVPAGCVMAFAGSTIPEGWLKCNGDVIPNAQGTVQGKTANFSTLYSIIGANLPDLRGYFIRGLDDGRGIDVGRVLNSNQNDVFKSHSHTAVADTQGNHSHSISGSGASANGTITGASGSHATAAWWGSLSIGSAGAHSHNVTVSSSGDLVETRPKNVALHYIIKY